MNAMYTKATRHLRRRGLKLRTVTRLQVFNPEPFWKGLRSHGLPEARCSESIKRNLERSLCPAEAITIL